MDELKIFNNEEFGEIRTLEMNNEVYFVGKDVAEALGYQEPRSAVSKKVDEEDRGVAKMDTPSGIQEMTVINESGLYSLVLGSKLETAKKFKRWVTSEVLPSIRKHSAFLMDNKIEEVLLNPDTLINLATQIKEERQMRVKAESIVEEMTPKALFADAVSASSDSILIRDLAKLIMQNGYDIGEKRLYTWLRENGYIIKNSKMPTQKSMRLGVFEVMERAISNSDGLSIIATTTKVTGKGQQYFINKFLLKAVV